MAVVVKWKEDGEYLCEFAKDEYGGPCFKWSKRQRDAIRFTSRSDAVAKIDSHLGRPAEVIPAESRFMRLVPKRRAEQAREETAALPSHRDLENVLREALRRMVAHLETEGRAGDGINEAAWDDYHASRMLVGRVNAGWDNAAGGRGIESIRRDALGATGGDVAPEMRPAKDIAMEMVEARSEGETFWLGDNKESIVLSHRFSDMAQGVDTVRRIVARYIERGRCEGERLAKAKAAGLVKGWNDREGRAMAERLTLDSSDVLWKQLLTEEANLARCARETGAAFGIAPTTPGKPPPDEAPKEHTEATHGGVTVTAPVEMSLSEVWAALTSAPALRVCLEDETRRAREDGIVDGMRRAREAAERKTDVHALETPEQIAKRVVFVGGGNAVVLDATHPRGRGPRVEFRLYSGNMPDEYARNVRSQLAFILAHHETAVRADARSQDAGLIAALRTFKSHADSGNPHMELPDDNLAGRIFGLGVEPASLERDGARHVAEVLLDVIERQGDRLKRELAEMDNLRDIAAPAPTVAETPTDAGMRIEQRADGEYLVGAADTNACNEMMEPGDYNTLCCYHVNGEHISTGPREDDDSQKICARWPIAPAMEAQ